MNNILLDLSGKIEPPKIETLYTIKNVADSLDIPFFIVGATARDLILEHCYSIKSPRRTLDIDLGVKVANWKHFKKLTDALLSTGRFVTDSKRQMHRFISRDIIFDIVPFGPISDKGKKISWPPEHEIIMSVLAFQEAYEYAVTVRLSTNPELDVRLPTLSGLTLMKLISWNDNHLERHSKDAKDLLFIMQKYEEAGNRDRLYEQELSLLEEEGFDTRLAGIRLLGRDMARIAEKDTIEAVKKILNNETAENSQYRLISDMIRGGLMSDGKFDEILQQLGKLRQGVGEGGKVLWLR